MSSHPRPALPAATDFQRLPFPPHSLTIRIPRPIGTLSRYTPLGMEVRNLLNVGFVEALRRPLQRHYPLFESGMLRLLSLYPTVDHGVLLFATQARLAPAQPGATRTAGYS